LDDAYRVPGGSIKCSPLAINPKADALSLAAGTQSRAHRLARLVEDMSGSDILNEDSIMAIHGYLQEVAALADAVVDTLAYQSRAGG